MKERQILNKLFSAEYEHPFDRKALDRLENTPGLDLLKRKVMEHGLEKFLRIKHTGNNIQITSKNIPELHELLTEACDILGVPEMPELYIFLEDKIRSYTSGEKQQVIVLSSGAIDLLNEEELLFLIGRELGHIKSNHVIYHMMAYSIKVVAQIISDVSLGLGNLVSMPLQAALLYWHRMSEFTADRAGMLTCQDLEVAGSALMKIAGLPAQYYNRVTLEDFRKQAYDFDELQATQLDKFIRFAADYENEQPFTVIRAKELFQWVESGAYDQVLTRQTLEMIQNSRCYHCNAPVFPHYNFCRFCGAPLKTHPEVQIEDPDDPPGEEKQNEAPVSPGEQGPSPKNGAAKDQDPAPPKKKKKPDPEGKTEKEGKSPTDKEQAPQTPSSNPKEGSTDPESSAGEQ